MFSGTGTENYRELTNVKGIAVTEAESPVKEISVRGADGVMEEMVFDVDRFIQRYIKIKPHQ